MNIYEPYIPNFTPFVDHHTALKFNMEPPKHLEPSFLEPDSPHCPTRILAVSQR
jgi:hypothetical protein